MGIHSRQNSQCLPYSMSIPCLLMFALVIHDLLVSALATSFDSDGSNLPLVKFEGLSTELIAAVIVAVAGGGTV